MYDFKNLTQDQQLQWLEIGISDLVTANLAQYPAIKVLSRDEILWSGTKPGGRPPARVNDALQGQLQELNVDIVAKGQIVRVENQVRIVSFLYRVGEAKRLKSFTHHGDVSDLFSIVDRLSSDISVYLDSSAGGDGAVLAAEASTSSPQQTWAIFSKQVAHGRRRLAMLPQEDRPAKLRKKQESAKSLSIKLNEHRDTESMKRDKAAPALPAPSAAPAELKDAVSQSDDVAFLDKAKLSKEATLQLEVIVDNRSAPTAAVEGGSNDGAARAVNELAEKTAARKAQYGGSRARAGGLADKTVAKVLPHYYRGLQFLTDNGVPPDSPLACRVTLCQELTSSGENGKSPDEVLKAWQAKVLASISKTSSK
jgi:TolB-like protein